MKKSFKIGDRVKVYGHAMICDGYANAACAIVLNSIARVTQINCHIGADLRVKIPGGETLYSVHSKQCRKMRPKQSPRKFWVTKKSLNRIKAHGEVCGAFLSSVQTQPSDVLFKEIIQQ